MQFQNVFFRYVGSPVGPATVALGADSNPRTVAGTSGAPPTTIADNVMSCVLASKSGLPVERVAVAMVGPTGAVAQNANLFIWDGNGRSHRWYLVNASPVSLVPGQVVFFDAVSSADPPPNKGNPGSAGGADYMLVVASTGSPPNGLYAFAMTPILTLP